MAFVILGFGMFCDSWSMMRFSVGSFLKTYRLPIGSMYQKLLAMAGRIWSL